MAATSAFLAASALPPAARTLLFQPAGAAVGGRVLLLKGAGGVVRGRALLLQGAGAGAGRALVAGPRRAIGDGDNNPSQEDKVAMDEDDSLVVFIALPAAGDGDQNENSHCRAVMQESLSFVALPAAGDGDESRNRKRKATQEDEESLVVFDLPAAGDGDDKGSNLSKVLATAMKEARLAFGCTAGVIVHGNKALVDQVHETVVLSRDLLNALAAKGSEPALIYKEVLVALAEMDSQGKEGYVSAHSLLRVMDGLRSLVQLVLGSEVAAKLSPYRARSSGPITAHDDKVKCLWALANDFFVLVVEVKWFVRQAPVPLVPILQRQFVIAHGDTDLLQKLTGTAMESQDLLSKLVDNAPLPDAVTEDELLAIGRAFLKLEMECGEGYATADAVMDALAGLKKMTAAFIGSAEAAGLRPDNPWPASGFSGDEDKISFVRDLATAFALLYADVKFLCQEYC